MSDLRDKVQTHFLEAQDPLGKLLKVICESFDNEDNEDDGLGEMVEMEHVAASS